MRKLNPYEKKQKEYFENIYKNKRSKIIDSVTKQKIDVNKIISDIQESVLEAYDDFSKKKKELKTINESFCNENQKKALLKCYEQSTNSLEALKGKIKKQQLKEVGNLCQFCGINSSNTFDHYLPKSSFPEFSIYAPNLIPCCSECNSYKKEIWLGEERCFINLYYDEIPKIPIIYARISIEDDTPVVDFCYIKNDEGILVYKDLDNAYTVYQHYNRLKLLKRFKENCNNYLYEIINALSIKNKVSKGDILEHMKEEHILMDRLYGINHWKSVLVKGIQDSEPFLDWCINGNL